MQGDSLSEAEATALFDDLIDPSVSSLQKAAVLGAMSSKGPSADELVGFVSAMRSRMTAVPLPGDNLLDTCGTGGGPSSFNLSTGAAFVAAAAGAKVAKHGNRAVSSQCGSADVLEALGVNLQLEVSALVRVFKETGIQFLFAPALHPAMKEMGPIRRELAVRTIFNFLGPLANPARAQVQLIGTFDRRTPVAMAAAASRLGVNRGVVVHARDGMDEVSPVAATDLTYVDGTTATVTPVDFGVQDVDMSPGATVEHSAQILRAALSGSDERRSAALIPSSAMSLVLVGLADSPVAGAELAWQTIRSGAAIAKLNDFIEATRS